MSGRPGRPLSKKLPLQVKFYTYRNPEVWEKIRELAQREGKPLQDIIVDALEEYLERHMPGNPQTPLSIFSGPAEIQVVEVKPQVEFKVVRKEDLWSKVKEMSTEQLIEEYRKLKRSGEISWRTTIMAYELKMRGIKPEEVQG